MTWHICFGIIVCNKMITLTRVYKASHICHLANQKVISLQLQTMGGVNKNANVDRTISKPSATTTCHTQLGITTFCGQQRRQDWAPNPSWES